MSDAMGGATGPPYTLTIRLFQFDKAGKNVFRQLELDSCCSSTTVGEIRNRIAATLQISASLVCLWLQKPGEEGRSRNVPLHDDRQTAADHGMGVVSHVYSLIKRSGSIPWQRDLEQKGLTYYHSGGDGNCQFRSVSKLVYGTEELHEVVRGFCMDYVEVQSHDFMHVCASELHGEGFQAYIDAKRKTDGSVSSYGDEPELVAMSELYRRPIEVWTFMDAEWRVIRKYEPHDPVLREPLRVCYLGQKHYDALVPSCSSSGNRAERSVGEGWQDGLLSPSRAGEWERSVLEQVRDRSPDELNVIKKARAAMYENRRRLEEEIPDHVREDSLKQLREEARRGLDEAMKESIEEENARELQAALEASQEDAEAEFREAERQSMEDARDQEQRWLDGAVEMSGEEAAQASDRAMEKARQESLQDELIKMGFPKYLAEYGAENAPDLESAMQEIQKLQTGASTPTVDSVEQESSKSQIIEDLMNMGFARHLAEYGAENASDVFSAMEVIRKILGDPSPKVRHDYNY